jgi:hypothetical protein
VPSSTREVFQSINKTIKTTYNIFQSSCNYLWNNKVKVILLGFAFEFYLAKGDKKCDAVLPIFDFPDNDLLARQYYSEFDVYANVESLSAAEYYFIGIRKHAASRFELQNTLVNLLGNGNNHIYMSGASGKFLCETLCLTPSLKPLVTFNSSECLPLTPLASDFDCSGWDVDAFKYILHTNAKLDIGLNERETVLSDFMKYSKDYQQQRDILLGAKSQLSAFDAKSHIVLKYPLGSEIWLAKMKIFLNIIHDVYSHCIKDKYPKMFIELEKIKNFTPEDVAYVMVTLIPRIEKDMLAIMDEYLNYLNYYKANYVEISNDKRINVGLIQQIEESKSDPNKKFFISAANFYLGNSSSQLFSNCNTSMIREDIHKSVAEKPFAMLIFKR